MNWNEVREYLSKQLDKPGPQKSDLTSLTQLSRKAERVGFSPDTFTKPDINKLRTIIVSMRNAAIDDDIERMEALLKAADEMSMIDLRLFLGKKVERIGCLEVGEVVVVTFTRPQYERVQKQLRAFAKFESIQPTFA